MSNPALDRLSSLTGFVALALILRAAVKFFAAVHVLVGVGTSSYRRLTVVAATRAENNAADIQTVKGK